MRRGVVALAGIAVAALAAPLVVLGQTGALKPLTTILNRPWPAPVVAEDESKPAPPLAPADAMKTFHLAPGYKLELVAAEPLTRDPILAEFDGDGRLWVVEMHGFAINDALENSLEPIGEVAVLEDLNGDGVFDKRTVFLDKLVLPRAIKVLDKSCALVGEPPNLIKACDTNGDLKADTRDILDTNFGQKGNIEHTANALYWGMDNTLVVSEHTYNIDFVDGQFKIVPNLRRGQWGVTQDSGGRIYRNVNTDPLFVDYVAPKYFLRNPNLVRTNGLYENLVKQEDTLIWPVHPTRGVNRGYRPDIFREDGSSTYYGGVSSPLIYRGDRLPKDIQNQPLVVDGPTNIVHLLKMTDDNGKLSAGDFYKKGELIASTDIRFRPVQVIGGPDGAVYVIDMYRGISQDGPIQTDYLRDYSAKRELARGINYGRIYRLVHETTVLDPKKPQMSKETPAQLVTYLSHPNGWWRDTAQQLIIQRGDKSVASALKRLAASAPQPYTRVHALWTLQGLGVLDQATAVKALADASPDVRAAAIRLSETWLTRPAVKAAVLKKADDGNWFVRRQLAATLGELPADQRMAPIVDLLRKYGDDPILVDIAVSGLNGQEEATLSALLAQPQASPDAVLALAGATAKGRDVASVTKLLTFASDAGRPAEVRAALMKGAALGLQGASGGGGGQAVVGGRAGAAVPGVGPRQQASAPGITLAAEPAGVTAIAAGSGPLADEAKQVLAMVQWPGKPAPPSGPARTPEEEKLFVAGKEVFANNCAACHGADGGGVTNVGAKLGGSQYATLPNDGTIRVLVNGKEGGGIGVMPPLGAAMSDEEVAAVLTFVRQSWGNTASAILPAQVKETRAAYAHRTTPWTEAELATRRR
jgi:mono/diheme cytochrome c family protein